MEQAGGLGVGNGSFFERSLPRTKGVGENRLSKSNKENGVAPPPRCYWCQSPPTGAASHRATLLTAINLQPLIVRVGRCRGAHSWARDKCFLNEEQPIENSGNQGNESPAQCRPRKEQKQESDRSVRPVDTPHSFLPPSRPGVICGALNHTSANTQR